MRLGMGDAGLLNRDAPDLGDLQQNNEKLQKSAWCTSRICVMVERKKRSTAGQLYGTLTRVVKPSAKKNADACPDCGHAIFWRGYYH